MFKIKKIVLMLACVSLLICMTFMQETFAKYVNSVSGTSSMTIARWKILVNNADITSGSLAANTIVPVFAGTTDMASNVIAPLATGYFDLVIDSTNTDLSFDYSISALAGATSSVSDLVSTGYSINGGTIYNFTDYNENITGTIAYGSTTTTIRIFVLWNDDANTQDMDNSADTEAALSETPTASMDVNISFIQSH
ncbi:MAG TPA: hypothetical protein PLT65_03070 [Bacilli bacterium]|nr:hypothetical protein [Bacilli bacterium]